MLKGAVGTSVGQTAAAAAAMLLVWLLPQADRARTPIPLPVERASNVFFARATINGLGPFWFTLDTGATLTVIDPAAAKRAGLVVRDAGRRTNVGITAGDVVVATTSGARIQVGGAPEFAPPQLFVVAVRANAGYLGHTVDGVLGTDFLHRHIVEFRYAESRVTLWPPSAVLKETTASVPFTMDGNLVIATATLTLPDGDHVPARLLIDTGSNGALTLTSPFVRRHRLTRRFPSRQASATVGINGIACVGGFWQRRARRSQRRALSSRCGSECERGFRRHSRWRAPAAVHGDRGLSGTAVDSRRLASRGRRRAKSSTVRAVRRRQDDQS
jgi:predicted aspartyl protease